jgi:hypothetical protein
MAQAASAEISKISNLADVRDNNNSRMFVLFNHQLTQIIRRISALNFSVIVNCLIVIKLFWFRSESH